MRASRARLRLVVMVVVGAAAALVTGFASSWLYAPAVGWGSAAAVFCGWVWLVLRRVQDAEQTKSHATREDPSRGTSDALILSANLASLVAVGLVVVRASHEHGATRGMLALVAVICVALSWLLVHTLYTLRYAQLYYTAPVGGIEFNQDEQPGYPDFAYVAFTLGMTYQVSDTNLTSSAIRSTVLRHALQSYIFGSVILATTINAVVTLSTTA
jgi:uncharacterized membrane protein